MMAMRMGGPARRLLGRRAVTRPLAACSASSASTQPPLPSLPFELEELARTTAAPLDRAKSLHPAFYVDETYARVERERIFSTQWFAVAHTAELASPGDVKVVEVGGTSIILTRDKNGRLNAFYNVCRHRGARLCHSSTKNCKQFVCPYHWWAYRLDGSLKSTPPVATPQDFKEDLGLLRVPGLETFGGLIFINQRANPPPLSESLGDLPEKLARYDLDSMQLHAVKDYDMQGDWKLLCENFVDFYHINAVHPALAKFSRVDDHLPYQGPGQYVGFVTAPLTDCGGPGDSVNFNAFPRLKKVESTAALFFHIFPNVSVTLYPHSMYTLIMLPTSTPGRTQEQLTLLMAGGARKEGDSDRRYYDKCQTLMDFVVNINDEDQVAIENLQRGLNIARAHGVQGQFLPTFDWPIHRFQNMVLGSLRGERVNESLMPQLDAEFEAKVLSENQ